MARKVTVEDIKQFNELYYKYKSYAEVARQTGWSAGTVSKYVDKNFVPVVDTDIQRFDMASMPSFSLDYFERFDTVGDMCVLSDEERVEIESMWKEIAV